jgi:N-acetylglucosamine-6-sulfatase
MKRIAPLSFVGCLGLLFTARVLVAVLVLVGAVSAQTFTPIRVNVGGNAYRDSSGNTWSADYGSNGAGGISSYSGTIAGTADQVLYQTWRYGYKPPSPTLTFTYKVPNGGYIVTLKFDETVYTAAGQRLFNVTANGQTVLSNFDIYAAVGSNTALDVQFPLTVTTGQITLAFIYVANSPKVCAIQIVAAPPPAPTLSAISPSSGTPGASVPVTLTGSNLSGATVNISGSGIGVTGVSSTATQITATFNVGSTASGSYNVTATTAGGTSNPVTFAVNGSPPPPVPSLSSITPSSGQVGSSVNVTLAGVNLSGATLNVSGTGITAGNVSSSSTQITATLTIASNAATGSYNVSATTGGGTSNTVAFQVNPSPPPASNLPNIVLVLSDDMRYDEMPYMPMLNSLIGAESVKFLSYFVTTPLCCPSRASMLTGLYSHNTGVYQNYGSTNAGAPAFKDSSTIATWLKGAGYATGLYGKYLNGYYNLQSGSYIPPGWTDWHAFVSSPGPTGNPSDGTFYYGYTINDNGVLTVHGSQPADYGTDVVFNDAINFIQKTPSGTPLFLYMAPYAPHDPFTPGPQDVGAHNCVPVLRPPSFNEADVSDKPAWVQALPLMSSSAITTNDNNYRASLDTLTSLDRDVQSLINALVASGRWSNTIFLFASDNGLFWGEHRLSNAKDAAFEEAVKVPLWIRVPGQATRTNNSLVTNIDLAPTIAAWAGITPPTKVNGVNLIPLLQGNASGWRTEILLEELGTITGNESPFNAVRTNQYKYVEYPNGDRELYDEMNDPYEMTNQISNPAFSSLISSLQSKLAALKGQ